MPDIQPSAQTTGAAPAFVPMPAEFADDVALGFECADPHLQIERWEQEASGTEPH